MIRNRLFVLVSLVLAVAAAVSAVALAGHAKSKFEVVLNPIPHNAVADGGSNVTGMARLKVHGTGVHVHGTGVHPHGTGVHPHGTGVHVKIHVRGLTPNLPHAMHIHGILGDANVCPPASADTSGDGVISLEEGAPFYGPVDTSFTTSGDTSAASALALERFPVADRHGNLNYNRTFMIPQSILDSLGSLHIVVHGLALDGNAEGPVGGYDTLFEAVLPVACGTISSK